MRSSYKYLLFFLGVFLSRLPFVFHGLGLDGDSWAVALAARHWHLTGIYEASRFPGYPLHEFLCSLFSGIGGIGPNLLSVFFTSLAALFFVLALQELRFRAPFLAGLALVSVPVVYISSTVTIDYTIALGFLMVAFYFLVRDRSLLTGVFVGLAIGCRMTSGAMLVPFALMLMQRDALNRNLWRIFYFCLSAIAVGVLCYVPSIMRYGMGFLTYYDVPYPSLSRIFYRFTIETWGVAGVLAILSGVLLLFLPTRFTFSGYLFPRSVNIKYVIAWLIAVDFYIIAFIKLPMESGYMIPAIPFVILIFGKYLIRPAFTFFCALLIVSPFFIGITPANRVDAATPSSASFSWNAGEEVLTIDLIKGPVIAYESRKQNGMRYINSVLHSFDTISAPAFLISGQWYNSLVYTSGDSIIGEMTVAPHVSEHVLVDEVSKGKRLYYLPRQDELNEQLRSADPNHFGATVYR